MTTASYPISAEKLLSALLSNAGWAIPPTDVVAIGVVRDPSTAASLGAPVVVQARGNNRLRFEVTLGGGKTTTIVNAGRAARISSNNEKKGFPGHSALSMRIPVFPFMDALQGIGTTKVLKYVGTDFLDGKLVDVIDAIPASIKGDSLIFMRSPQYFRIWITRETGLLAQLSYVRLADSNPLAATTYVRKYSDYRLVNGRLFPFHQEQSMQGGGVENVIDFLNVTFDTGLPEATFDVPPDDREAQ